MKKYLCGVSFQHELGECDDIHFYDSLQELKEKSKCYLQCGVVEIEIEFESHPQNYTSHTWVEPPRLDWSEGNQCGLCTEEKSCNWENCPNDKS